MQLPEWTLAVREPVENIWRKLLLFAVGLLHLLFSHDKEWPRKSSSSYEWKKSESNEPHITNSSESADANAIAPQRRKKRIIFVRHGESEWNVVFNRKDWWFALLRFCQAVIREWLMLPTRDSIFIDSPLSLRGIRQCEALYEHVCEKASPPEFLPHPPDHLLRYLGCPLPNSIIVSSNLRRAIDTARVASAARLDLPDQRIHVLSCLQEIGRNIDTLAINEAYDISPRPLPLLHQVEKRKEDLYSLAESHGNKTVLGCGRNRLMTFAKWVFCHNEDVIIAYGHSYWFRAFCQEFFPPTVAHEAKTVSVANCGVVTFELEETRTGGLTQYMISPQSFEYLR